MRVVRVAVTACPSTLVDPTTVYGSGILRHTHHQAVSEGAGHSERDEVRLRNGDMLARLRIPSLKRQYSTESPNT